MAVKIGHASIDERGRISGGGAGDQTGKEVCIRTWYSNKWGFVLRPKNAIVAEKMALACEAGCANSKIGYDQGQRNTLNTQAAKVDYDLSKIANACECDCSSFMTVCAQAAGISIPYTNGNAPTTSTMETVWKNTGAFDVLKDEKYLTSDVYLKRGDVLVKPGSHTVMVLENGSGVISATTTTGGFDMSTLSTIKSGSTGPQVKSLQSLLNGKNDAGLAVDGSCGPKTVAAIKAYQKAMGLSQDGHCGPKTWASILTK